MRCMHGCLIFFLQPRVHIVKRIYKSEKFTAIRVLLKFNQSLLSNCQSPLQEPIKSLIVAKSWSDRIASKQLAQLIWQYSDIRFHTFDYLIPVPLHWSRFAKRGFNQSHEIANVLASYSGKQVAHVVKRTKKTLFQAGLNPEQRHANVAASFALCDNDSARYYGKHLVIVDDLLTTGATVRAVAQILLQLKPASLTVVVASRVTR